MSLRDEKSWGDWDKDFEIEGSARTILRFAEKLTMSPRTKRSAGSEMGQSVQACMPAGVLPYDSEPPPERRDCITARK